MRARFLATLAAAAKVCLQRRHRRTGHVLSAASQDFLMLQNVLKASQCRAPAPRCRPVLALHLATGCSPSAGSSMKIWLLPGAGCKEGHASKAEVAPKHGAILHPRAMAEVVQDQLVGLACTAPSFTLSTILPKAALQCLAGQRSA